jgi:O-Antigen ligase
VREKSRSLGGAGDMGPETSRKENAEKSRRPGRLLAVFKAVVLLVLAAACTYGMLYHGLYSEEYWLPVAAGVLALILVTLFVRGYYQDISQAAWVMVALLAVLVGVKGLSMMWTMSQTETINEVLRSSMYLAVFLAALGALTSGRQVGPLMDISVLMITALAGYGFLQKMDPAEYPVTSLDGVRIDSTLGYGNSVAVVVGMGVMLALARLTAMRNVLVRGLYAVLTLAFLVALYLTFSRGGIGSLGVGLISLFVLGRNRLQMLTNLLLLSVPGGWLLWRMQDLEGLLQTGASEQQRMVAGAAFRTDLILALAAAFVLQVGYALLVNRYDLVPLARRVLVTLVIVGTLLAVGAGAFAILSQYGGIDQTYEALASNPVQAGRTENVAQRLTSLSPGYREYYWRVGWEAWKEHPFTGTGAGTFQFVWLENRPVDLGVKQVHNLYLEQGTETGVFAFLALVGFVVTLVGYTARATWRSRGSERRLLLAGLVSALVVYLVSSFLEWHWYIPGSTLIFFFLAGITAKFASKEDWDASKADRESSPDEQPRR